MKKEKYVKISRRYGDRRDKTGLPVARVLFPILSVIVMLLIFLFSAQQGNESQALSDGIMYRLLELLEGTIPSGVISFLQLYFRKAAHFFLYMLLGIFVGNSFFSWLVPESEYDIRVTPDPRVDVVKVSARSAWIYSLIVCIIYAITDEWHQTFVPGRSGEISDVLLDSASSLIGLLLLLIFVAHKIAGLHRQAMKKLG